MGWRDNVRERFAAWAIPASDSGASGACPDDAACRINRISATDALHPGVIDLEPGPQDNNPDKDRAQLME